MYRNIANRQQGLMETENDSVAAIKQCADWQKNNKKEKKQTMLTVCLL